jgi:molybdopterin converting factor small subunit
MKVRVRLYAFLAEQYAGGVRPGSPLDLDLPEGSTVASLVETLALPDEQVKLTVVNGRMQERVYRLQPEDEVGIFPPIAGG